MAKIIYESLLYIVSENDTLETIAKKYKLSIDEILSFNPIIKNHNIHNGQTLLIPQKDEESNTERNLKEYSINEIKIIICHFYLRLIIYSILFNISDLSLLINKFNSNKNELKLENSIESIVNTCFSSIINYAQCVKKNNKGEIEKLIKTLKNKYNEYLSISSNQMHKDQIHIVYTISKLWIKLINSISISDYEKSEKIFDQILALKKW